MIFELKRGSHLPLYEQIATQLRSMIAVGTLKIGDRLPANRDLAKTLGVNRTTVTTAYSELLADGLITSHVGRGTFVSAVPAGKIQVAPRESSQAAPIQWSVLLADQRGDHWLGAMRHSSLQKRAISLEYSLPQSDLFPIDDFRRAVDHVLRKEGRALVDSGATAGYEPLRDYIASQMSLSGRALKPQQILVTSGCQQALALVREVLIGPGDEVAVECPTYPGALSVFCRGDSKHVCVPLGPGGMDLDVLEDILSQRRPRFVYTIPSFNNPTGVTLDLASRRRLLNLAVRYKVPIIEDDIYGELRYNGPSLPSLKALDEHGIVVYVNSFSKIGFPGLRVGWIAADETLIAHVATAKRRNDLHTSLLAQASIYEFSRRGLLARHIARAKKAYSERRDVMLSALEKYFPGASAGATWTRPEGGMAIWVTLPESLNAGQVLLESLEKGVIFSPGELFYPNLAPANKMRLSFSTVGPREIEEAIKRLGAILRNRLAGLKRHQDFRSAAASRALV